MDNYFIPHINISTLYNHREETLVLHDAFADALEDRAVVMTFLADLGDFQKTITYGQAVADADGGQIDAGGGDVFREYAGLNINALSMDVCDILGGQQTDLTMTGTGVRVAVDAVTGNQLC